MERKYFVADNNGNILGHDLDKKEAEFLLECATELDPDGGWEMMEDENI